MKKNTFTNQLVVMAFIIAIEIILSRFLSIQLPIARIGFGFLPVAICGIMFGPYWASLCYVAGDLLGMMIYPTGPYFPGFTLSAALTGLIYGFILHNKPVTVKRCLIATLAVLIPISLVLNTFWLQIIMGKGFLAILPTRIVQVIVMIPVQTLVIPLVWQKILSRVPYIASSTRINKNSDTVK